MKLVNLENELDKIVFNFLGGMKCRLLFVIILLLNFNLIILDELMVGIDLSFRKEIWK